MIFSSQVPQQVTDISPSVASGDVPSEGANVSQKDTNLPPKGVNASQSDHDTNPPPEGTSVPQSEHDTDLPPEGEVHESSPEDVAQKFENDDVFFKPRTREQGCVFKNVLYVNSQLILGVFKDNHCRMTFCSVGSKVKCMGSERFVQRAST